RILAQCGGPSLLGRSGSAAEVDEGPALPTTVYKKHSPNSRLALYLSTREFVLSSNRVSSIDGVVLVDPAYLKDRRIFAMVLLTFRYGREDEEVMGLKFFTEAILDFKQVYPEGTTTNSGPVEELTVLQQNLIKKLGSDAYPLTLRVSPQAPPSVRLHPARPYQGSPLGVSYDLKVFIGERSDEKPQKRDTVRMALRCVQYAEPAGVPSPPPPTASAHKSFVLCPGRLDVEATLDKETYHQGDAIHIHVAIKNGSSKTVQRVKVAVLQHVHVCMFTHGRFKNIVGSGDTGTGRAVLPGASLSREFMVRLESCEKFPVALAIESEFHDAEGYNLSSTTLLANPKDKNPYGVNVSYEVKVKAILSCIDRPIVLRLPFKVVQRRPPEGVVRPPIPKDADCVSEDISRLVVHSPEVTDIS
ncbi:arrestin homolog, partial [Ornithodoros turicata]|uniref:arrestin homolog n=1 Tax=Ornithodoros turicata TaxID=34597 RepID=UPI003139229A